MILRVSPLLLFVCGVYVRIASCTAADDDLTLVQGRLTSSSRAQQPPQPTVIVINNSSQATPAPTEFSTLYQVRFKQTWGDDHICLTEMSFYDILGNPIKADLVETSSCWGCAVSCSNCTVDYGNPRVLFDGLALDTSPTAYFCTDFGTFPESTGRMGVESVTFRLAARPHTWALRRPDLTGTAIARTWTLDELQWDGEWATISSEKDHIQELNQSSMVQFLSGPAGRWWEYETSMCMQNYAEPPVGEGVEPRLNFTENDEAVVVGMGNNGRGIYVDGNFGGLQLPDAFYYAKQVHFHFPSFRKMVAGKKNREVVATGEMHIVTQKPDGRSTSHTHQDGIALIVIPLLLPLEGNPEEPTETEKWFPMMGFDDLPPEGGTKKLKADFNLSAFSSQLSSTFTDVTPLCQEPEADGSLDERRPKWLLSHTPAIISGTVVQAFKDLFPYDTFGPDWIPGPPPKLKGSWEGANRDGLTGLSIPKKPDPEEWPSPSGMPWVMPKVPEGWNWNVNPDFYPGTGEFNEFGAWITAGPTVAPTVTPTQATDSPTVAPTMPKFTVQRR